MPTPSGYVLDLSSLPERHPRLGEDLRDTFGPRLVYRLSVDPFTIKDESTERTIHVEWLTRPGAGSCQYLYRLIGWGKIAGLSLRCRQVAMTTNVNSITEQAAVAMMALLISDLEQGVLVEVLQIGTRADYLFFLKNDQQQMVVEVSGIREVSARTQSWDRVRQKAAQLLDGQPCGYVSVSSFSHPPDGIAHSYLWFFARPSPDSKSKASRKRKVPLVSAKIDTDGSATRAALQGEKALGEGDTELAKQKYTEAGDILESVAATQGPAEGRNFTLFMAASQYYRGGQYRRASKICKKVSVNELSQGEQSAFSELKEKAANRAKNEYAKQVGDQLVRFWTSGKAADILASLQNHPYVLDRSSLALVRSVCCELLGKYTEAAIFTENAYRFSGKVEMITGSAWFLLTLASRQQFEDAEEYARRLMEIVPHPVTFGAASIVGCLFARLHPKDMSALHQEIQLFEKARPDFLGLNERERNSFEVQYLMKYAYHSASLAYWCLNRTEGAQQISAEGIKLWPDSPDLWSVYGMVRYPKPESLDAFRKAVELKDNDYVAYYHLSHEAFGRGGFNEALHWGRLALAKLKQGQMAAARLHAWVAGCLEHTGGSWEEIAALYKKASELDPGDLEIADVAKLSSIARATVSAQPIDLKPDTELRDRLLTFRPQSRIGFEKHLTPVAAG